MTSSDHPIFLESIKFIKAQLGVTDLDRLEQDVLERLIHSSGDFSIKSLVRFSPQACQKGINALKAGAPILTDTAMAAAGIQNMAARTINSSIFRVIDWAPNNPAENSTRLAKGIELSWKDLTLQFNGKKAPIVLIGSAPTALVALLDAVVQGALPPSLIIGMPVGFIGVVESKRRLFKSGLPYIGLSGSRGGASLVASTANALLRASI